jgi:hypothetical protein
MNHDRHIVSNDPDPEIAARLTAARTEGIAQARAAIIAAADEFERYDLRKADTITEALAEWQADLDATNPATDWTDRGRDLRWKIQCVRQARDAAAAELTLHRWPDYVGGDIDPEEL